MACKYPDRHRGSHYPNLSLTHVPCASGPIWDLSNGMDLINIFAVSFANPGSVYASYRQDDICRGPISAAALNEAQEGFVIRLGMWISKAINQTPNRAASRAISHMSPVTIP